MKAAVIVFPGSNCDRDMRVALRNAMDSEPVMVWHGDSEMPDVDLITVPGGFSYGDYLRAGAMARFSPVVSAIVRFARDGGPVLGTCNGFQILCESGLLPGALVRNHHLHFICDLVCVRVERQQAPFTSRVGEGEVLKIPIKHGEGAYTVSPSVLAEMENRNQVVLRYCDAGGRVGAESNPNGSVANIAGIVNAEGNVMGLMPHPEHAVEPGLGGTDGLAILGSMLDFVQSREAE